MGSLLCGQSVALFNSQKILGILKDEKRSASYRFYMDFKALIQGVRIDGHRICQMTFIRAYGRASLSRLARYFGCLAAVSRD